MMPSIPIAQSLFLFDPLPYSRISPSDPYRIVHMYQTIVHYGHAFVGLYVMFGGFMAFPIVYTLFISLVIWGWIMHDCTCVVNDGFDYPKGSLTEAYLKELGIQNGKGILAILLPLNLFVSFFRTKVPIHLLAYGIYLVQCYDREINGTVNISDS